MTEPNAAGAHARPGFVIVGGRAIIEHQLDIALDFGCDRVICLVNGLDPQLLLVQHRVERAGKFFQTASAPRDLSALVTANDEVIMFAEGLLTDRDRALKVLETGTGVFVQPVESGLAAGFERVDINNASAGMLRIPGRLIDSLAQISAEYNVTSALTRIALQDGMPMREVPPEARSGLNWQMVRNENDAFAIEHDWLAHQLGHVMPRSPGRWIAQQGVMSFGPSLLHGGKASTIVIAATALILALSLGIASFGWPVGGFLGCAVGWVFYQAALLLRRIEQPRLRGDGARVNHTVTLDWIFDILLVLLTVWAGSQDIQSNFTDKVFVPVIFLLLVRLLPQVHMMLASVWLSDRAFLALAFASLAALGVLHWALVLASVLLVALTIFVTRSDGG